jgi:hypothetical protein
VTIWQRDHFPLPLPHRSPAHARTISLQFGGTVTPFTIPGHGAYVERKLTVTILSIDGRIVAQRTQLLDADATQLRIDGRGSTRNTLPGVYLCRITAHDIRHSQFIIVR